MKWLAVILIVVAILGLGAAIFFTSPFVNPPETAVIPTSTPQLSPEEEVCRKKVVSDNKLFEDRMIKAIKTCEETQICTYTDFRMYSSANGQYVPDWRSAAYMDLEITKCLEAQN